MNRVRREVGNEERSQKLATRPQKEGEQECEHERSRYHSVTLPNGSRLSCGRLARRRKGGGRQSVPTRAQHSASLKAITARQLQAHVRQRALPSLIHTAPV